MSTSPYSLDLRKKVIEFLQRGNSQKLATEIFGIHRNTISRWRVRMEKEGSFEARPRLGFKSKVAISALEDFVNNNPNTKLLELGNKFGVTAWQAGRILKKLGFSYKKKPFPTWKQIQKKELST